MKRQRARGEGFFAAAETQPYQPRGLVLGQETPDSCVAACCRMLLFDQLPTRRHDYLYAESFLRAELGTGEDGSVIALIPTLLKQFGAARPYVYRRAITIEELQKLVRSRPAIAFIPTRTANDFHALIVDAISADSVAIRDPLPAGWGTMCARLSRKLFIISRRLSLIDHAQSQGIHHILWFLGCRAL